jgi:hypothetical protein
MLRIFFDNLYSLTGNFWMPINHMAMELVDSNAIVSVSTKVFEHALLHLHPGAAMDESTYKDSL